MKLCLHNEDTLIICMKECGSQKCITNRMTATELEQIPFCICVLNRGYACAIIVQTNAIQFLPELCMNQFDTLSTQWIQIEHMHEGVLFKSNIIDKIAATRTLTTFLDCIK